MTPLPLYRVNARGRVADYRDTRTVIFHQIIETGGSTLSEVLYRAIKRRGTQFRNAQALLEDPELVAALAPELGLIYGHNAYGLHHQLPGPTRTFTMLREPVIAYVSRFYNWTFMSPSAVEYASLEEYVEAGERPNHQARDLARCPDETKDLDYDLGPDELYRRARQVLEERMVFCGITDLFEETIFMLAAMFGWPQVNMWQRRLSTPGRPTVDALAPELVARVERLVEVDRALYDAQRAKLLRLVADADFDDVFHGYKAEAQASDARSFAEANIQKYEMLINQLRRELEQKELKIQAQAVALVRSQQLLTRAQEMINVS